MDVSFVLETRQKENLTLKLASVKKLNFFFLQYCFDKASSTQITQEIQQKSFRKIANVRILLSLIDQTSFDLVGYLQLLSRRDRPGKE